MLLLHIFEKFGDRQQSPSDAHAKFARDYFLHRFSRLPLTNMRHILQLESLIYRVAVTCLFQPHQEKAENYTFLDGLVNTWAVSSIQGGLWQHSLWIGLQPPIFNTVFKLAVLLRQVPRNILKLSELGQVEDYLRQHLTSLGALLSQWVDQHYGLGDNCALDLKLSDQTHAAQSLYSIAGWIVMSRLRGPSALQAQATSDELSRLGYCWLNYLTRVKFFSPVLIWPVIIIGLTASSVVEHDTATTYVNALAPASGLRAATSVVGLFKKAFEKVDGFERAGINLLFYSEALATVFI